MIEKAFNQSIPTMFLQCYSLYSLILPVYVIYYKQKRTKLKWVEEQVLECRLVIDKDNETETVHYQ